MNHQSPDPSASIPIQSLRPRHDVVSAVIVRDAVLGLREAVPEWTEEWCGLVHFPAILVGWGCMSTVRRIWGG
jgi:hypothetical protein